MFNYMRNKVYKVSQTGFSALFKAFKLFNNDDDDDENMMSKTTTETNFKRTEEEHAEFMNDVFGEDSNDDPVFGSTRKGEDEDDQYHEYSDVDDNDADSHSSSGQDSAAKGKSQARSRRVIDDDDDDDDNYDGTIVIVKNSNNRQRKGPPMKKQKKGEGKGKGKAKKQSKLSPTSANSVVKGADKSKSSGNETIRLVPPERRSSFRVPPFPQHQHNIEKYPEDDEDDAATALSASPTTGS